MALMIAVKNNNGTVSNYHKIMGVSISSRDTGKFNVSVNYSSYVNQDKRKENIGYAIGNGVHTFTADEELMISKPIMELAYEQLKTKEAFKNAIDC